MKRLFALALALVILAVPALADDNPLADFSMEQLQGTDALIQAEILRRTGEPFVMLPGVYVAGEAIMPGAWRVEMRDETGTGFVRVWRSIDDMTADFPVPLQEYLLSHAEGIGVRILGSVWLPAGAVLQLEIPVVVSPFTGVQP